MSSFRSFGGEFRKEARVSLAGRSRTEAESRAEVLERTRRERERRRQDKLEARSATSLQAAWRGWCARRRQAAEVRRGWEERYGAQAERAASADLAPSSGFLRHLTHFAHPATSAADMQLLAVACRLLLTSRQPAAGPAAAGAAGAAASSQAQPQPQPPLLLCMHASGGGEAAGAVLQQAQRLIALCLEALAAHAPHLAADLQQPRVGGAAAAAASSSPALPLLEVVLLLTSADSWKPALGAAAAAEATAQLLAAAVASGLFGQLARIAATACPESSVSAPTAAAGAAAGGGAGGGGSQVQRQGVPAGEALATALTVRYLSQQAAIAKRLQQAPLQQRRRLSQLAGGPERQLPLLLCLPLLTRRLPSLQPVAGRLWRQAVPALQPLSAAELAAWLQAAGRQGGVDAGPCSSALAAAALLGNLLEGCTAALKADDAVQLEAVRKPALQFAELASTLLTLLPRQPFFPSSGGGSGGAAGGDGGSSSRWGDDEDDDEEAAAAAAAVVAAAAPGVSPLPWDPEQLPSTPLLAQLHLLSDGGVLRALVRATLPLSSPASASAASAAGTATTISSNSTQQQQQAVAVVPLAQRAADARRVCSLLQQLMLLPGQRQRVLVMLAFSSDLVPRLWYTYLRPAQAAPVEGYVPSGDSSCDPGWMLPLTLFSLAASAYLSTAGDEELYQEQRPLPLHEIYNSSIGGSGGISRMGGPGAAAGAGVAGPGPGSPGGVLLMLKMALWHALWVEVPPSPGGWSPEAAALRAQLKEAAGKLMGQLHDRNCRRAFAPPEAFQADALPADRFQAEIQVSTAAGRQLSEAAGGGSSGGGSGGGIAGAAGPGAGLGPGSVSERGGRAWGLLHYAPYLVPFRERAKLFQAVVAQERARYRDMEVMHSLPHELGGPGGPANRFYPIKRVQVLQDAYDQLNGMGDAMHGRIRIQFIDAHGLVEAGVDGGGIFKEFVETVVREGFDPNVGLFKATTDNRLYPNPHAQLVVGSAVRLIQFLGKMVGKAMYEGILVELPLAPFFLKKFRGAYCDINDLPTLDPELHRNLVFLKRYEGDVADLGLTFTVTDNVLGATQEVDLVPRGRDVAVTSDNRLAYIHRVADYKLNRQIREPAAAFLRGVHDLIRPEWVRMFNEEELQMLISGGQQGLDIEDMRAHVQYSGGYHADHPVIQQFWAALSTFTPHQQADFLRFVTSCPRPPLLGFKYLEPPLAIQLAGSMLDERAADRLPTAATCMNLLKLPPYRTAAQIRDKLLYAIESGAGFELS